LEVFGSKICTIGPSDNHFLSQEWAINLMRTRHIWVHFNDNSGATDSKRHACTISEDPNRPGDPAPSHSVHLTWTKSRGGGREYRDCEKRFLEPAQPKGKGDDVIIVKQDSPHVGQVFKVTRLRKKPTVQITVSIDGQEGTFEKGEVCRVSDSIDFRD
jgi:hypothetical protein